MKAAASPPLGPTLVRLSLAATTFLAFHVAILKGAISWAVAIVFCSLALAVGAKALHAARRRRSLALIAALLLGVAASASWWQVEEARAALILPPLAGLLLTSAFFAYSLLPGQIPVIVRMCHVTQGAVLPDGLEAYARALTWGWAVLPAVLALASMLALGLFGLEAWSWVCNVVNPLVFAAFFLGEHLYRAWRLPHVGKPSILRTLGVMLDSASWQRSS